MMPRSAHTQCGQQRCPRAMVAKIPSTHIAVTHMNNSPTIMTNTLMVSMAVLAIAATRTAEGFTPSTIGLISSEAKSTARTSLSPLYSEETKTEETSAFIPPSADESSGNSEDDDGKYLSTVEMFGKGAAKVCAVAVSN